MLNPNIPGPVRVSILERLVPSFTFALAALSGAVGAVMLLIFLRAMGQSENAGYASFFGGLAELEFAVGIVLVLAAALGAIGILVSAIRLFTSNTKASPSGVLFLVAGLLGFIPPLALRYILQMMKGAVNSPTGGGISSIGDTITAVSYFTIGSAVLIGLIMLAFAFVPFSSSSGKKVSAIVCLVLVEILIAALAGLYFWEASKSLTERDRDRPEFGSSELSESSNSSDANKYETTFPPELGSNTSNNSSDTNSPMQGKTISGGVINSKAIDLQQPPYPPAARAVGAKGAVSVQVLVDEKGEVVSANALSGHPLLRASAVQTARQTRFVVTKLSGQPVKVSGVVTFRFE